MADIPLSDPLKEVTTTDRIVSYFKPTKLGSSGVEVSLVGAVVGAALTKNIAGLTVGAFGGAMMYNSIGPKEPTDPDDGVDPDPDPDPGPGNPGPDPDPDPDPNPDPDPDPDPDPEVPPVVSVFDTLMKQKGAWSSGAKGASVLITMVDRYVSVELKDGVRRQVVPLYDVRKLVPNDVTITGASPAVLDSECQTSFGKNLFGLLESGALGIDEHMSGFYLQEFINRDAIVKGLPPVKFTSVFQNVGSWGISCSPILSTDVEMTREVDLGGGPSFGIYEKTFTAKLNFGSSVDGVGLPNPIGNLGELIREISLGTQAYAVPNADYVYTENDPWGKGKRRTCHPASNLATVTAFLRDAVIPTFRAGEKVTMEDICLYYIDNPSIRPLWDTISISEIPITHVVSFTSHLPPYLGPGQQIP